jgi:hypothetical protein|tara:strand:- start:307 stop:501 length:195 start_codon:yes stop_codon:yes gene_type:complete
MGLIDKITNTKINNPLLSSKDSLDSNEIALILNLIKSSPFKGKDIETIYNLVIKLQNQYTKLEK